MTSTDSQRLPMVPLREAVVFPHTMVPFVVGRRSSLKALERAGGEGPRRIFLACQRDATADDPHPEEIFTVGTVATVAQSLKVASGNVRMLVEGEYRARAVEIVSSPDGFLVAEVLPLPDRPGAGEDLPQLARQAGRLFESYVKRSPALPAETVLSALKVNDPGRLADTIAAHLLVQAEIKQDLLERVVVRERLEALIRVLEQEIDKLQLDRSVDGRVKEQLEQAQREYYLSEKIKAIQKELGRGGREDEMQQLRERIEQGDLPDDAREKASTELARLEVMPPVSAEATVSRTYLDWLLSLPWSKKSREKRDLGRARKILERDHHGLEEVKERILEHLAVTQLAPRHRQNTILCFAGPPGVGKTSLARSIAEATGRRFVRLSLGGVRDEAEIRGHRRTYIGAFPGRIIQALRKAGRRNPVFLLDELDKMSMDFRGDPSAALLEVLDPEQNSGFVDHYIDTEFDLSSVFFIATANVMHSIPPALKDRLETIRIAGYTLEEKLVIAERFLVPRQLTAHGLGRRKVRFGREALQEIVERYTREAGVRSLERQIAGVCRKLARGLVEKTWTREIEVGTDDLAEWLGVPRYRPSSAREENEVGVATGLAWTPYGGELLSIEACAVPGRGKLIVTGQVGDVMQESAQAALTYVRSRAAELGIDPGFYRRFDLHIHVPEGAIPKDGPSAGIALASALISILTGVPLRADLAMSGEITLQGKVLPVGGIKEKVLAAHRSGLRRVMLPEENEKNLKDLPSEVLGQLELILVRHVDEVLPAALTRMPSSLPLLHREGEDGSDRPH